MQARTCRYAHARTHADVQTGVLRTSTIGTNYVAAPTCLLAHVLLEWSTQVYTDHYVGTDSLQAAWDVMHGLRDAFLNTVGTMAQRTGT